MYWQTLGSLSATGMLLFSSIGCTFGTNASSTNALAQPCARSRNSCYARVSSRTVQSAKRQSVNPQAADRSIASLRVDSLRQLDLEKLKYTLSKMANRSVNFIISKSTMDLLEQYPSSLIRLPPN